jgi:hypothetical protein
MTLKERIQETDRTADPHEVRKLLDHIRRGGVKFQGRPVIFTYADTVELFGRQGVSADRFEELCRLADYAW